jgi:hypothetical protein
MVAISNTGGINKTAVRKLKGAAMLLAASQDARIVRNRTISERLPTVRDERGAVKIP